MVGVELFMMLKMDTYWKWISAIHTIYMTDDDYPLTPESLEIVVICIHPLSRQSSHRKLMPNLRDKDRYVVHYRNLKV